MWDENDAGELFRRSTYRLNLQMRHLTTMSFTGNVTIGTTCKNALGQPTVAPVTVPVSMSFNGLDMAMTYKPVPASNNLGFRGELSTVPTLSGVSVTISSGALSSFYRGLMEAAGFNQARVQAEVNKLARTALGESLTSSAGPLLDDLFNSTVLNSTHDYLCAVGASYATGHDPAPPFFDTDVRTATYRCFVPET